MAGIGHLAVGVAAGRFIATKPFALAWKDKTNKGLVFWMVSCSSFSFLPDFDVISFRFGIPYHDPFGHRGASHSLFFAAIVALLLAWAAHKSELNAKAILLFSFLIVASHGLLDTMTTGGLGSALFWPFSTQRFFASWRPIPVSPLGRRIFSPYGFHVMMVEFVYFFPLFLYAFWPRSPSNDAPAT